MGLDGVEIVMAWEEGFGVSIADAEAATLRTPRSAIDLICRKLKVREGDDFCFSRRIFYLLRKAFVTVLDCPRAAIPTHTRLGDLIPGRGRRQTWAALSKEAGLPFPGTTIGVGFLSPTVGEVVTRLTAHSAGTLIGAEAGWSRRQVREVVRAAVATQIGFKDFSDDVDFVRDLRID